MADPARDSDAILADRLVQYNDAPFNNFSSNNDEPPLLLPVGPCSFRELSLGRDAQACGCNAFWLNGSFGREEQTRKATCFCGHHACFHALERGRTNSGGAYLAAQTPLEFHGSAVFKAPGGASIGVVENGFGQDCLQAGNFAQTTDEFGDLFAGDWAHGLEQQDAAPGLGLFVREPSARASASHHGHARQQSAGFRLPGTSRASEIRPPSNHSNTHRNMPSTLPSLQVPSLPDTAPDESLGSATEVATPSVAGTPAVGFQPTPQSRTRAVEGFTQAMAAINREFASRSDAPSTTSKTSRRTKSHSRNGSQIARDVHPTHEATITPSPVSAKILSELTVLKDMVFKTADFGRSMKLFHQRLERLETVSFSHVTDHDLTDRLESFDARLLEIASRVEELESFREHFNNATTSFQEKQYEKSRVSRGSSFESVVPPGMNALDGLLQRLESLEAAVSPSAANPWEVEVVLLPWDDQLNGIWFEGVEASQASAFAEESHDGRNQVHAAEKRRSWSGSVTQEWSGAAANRLSPRACGPTGGTGGMVFSRLKSRGFVQSVRLDTRDASFIYTKIAAAFSKLLHIINEPFMSTLATSQRVRAPVGLQGEFVPLRKVHKSSRLRYLSAAELTTPSLWTADFLDSSVFMKAAGGQRRLFITQPAAYFQQSTVDTPPATWQSIRQLPRYKTGTSAESSFVGEGDAKEACWAFNPRLDTTTSAQSSFSSAHQTMVIQSFSPEHSMVDPAAEDLSSNADDDDSDDELHAGSTSSVRRPSMPPITPITDFSVSQAQRSASLPATQELVPVTIFSGSGAKRNAVSFNAVDSLPVPIPDDTHSKRRRHSPAFDAPRDLQNPTPRQSREPPSPESNARSHDWRGEDLGSVVPRASPSVPYATPYSNTMALDWTARGNDTGALDVLDRTLYGDEDVWDGVSDSGADEAEVPDDSTSEMDGEDDNEDMPDHYRDDDEEDEEDEDESEDSDDDDEDVPDYEDDTHFL